MLTIVRLTSDLHTSSGPHSLAKGIYKQTDDYNFKCS